MVKRLLLASAMMALAFNNSSAQALSLTNNYMIVASGLAGPVSGVTIFLQLTYDPALSSSEAAVDSYSSNSLNASFNPSGGVGFSFFPGVKQFQIGGLLNGAGLTVVGTNDFYLGFIDNGSTISSAVVGYTAVGQIGNNSTFNVQVTRAVVPGVPEPATWAMMLLGFAAVGAASRRRSGKQALISQ